MKFSISDRQRRLFKVVYGGLGVGLGMMLIVFFRIQHLNYNRETAIRQEYLRDSELLRAESHCPTVKCNQKHIRGWEQFTNEHYGLSLSYPAKGYFGGVRQFSYNRIEEGKEVWSGGVLFTYLELSSGRAGGQPYYDAVIHISFDDFFYKLAQDMVLSERLKKVAWEHRLPNTTSILISTATICGNPAAKTVEEWIDGDGFSHRRHVAYFAHNGHVLAASVHIIPRFYGTPEEDKYIALFEQMLRTIQFE